MPLGTDLDQMFGSVGDLSVTESFMSGNDEMDKTRLIATLGIASLGLWLGLCSLSSADETLSKQLEFTDGVIVLTDGRVFSGRISNLAGGYRIDWSGTYAIVPFGKVDVTARSLNEAYLALRDRTLKPTANFHLALAEWCLQNQLVGPAKSEVTKALKLEPLRAEARTLLVTIDERLNPRKEKVDLPSGSAMTIDGFLRSPEKAANGFSREVHREYIRQVQPLILNKCGNAYCHGQAAKNSFRLESIQRGISGNRLLSQSNLDQVMNQLDFANPSQSPLLLKAVAVDARHRKIFLGQQGGEQFKLLSDWVRRAATELPSAEKRTSKTIVQNKTTPEIQLTGAEADRNTPRKRFQENTLLQEVRQQSRPDPFDPDVFNRRVHGAAARELGGRAAPQPTATTKE